MRLAELPEGHTVAVDTETSGTRVDSGGRVSVVSFAFRHPETGNVERNALPFDQGHQNLPLGRKELSKRHLNRIAKWPEDLQEEVAPNLSPDRYYDLLNELVRFRLVYHQRKFDETMLATGLRNVECDWKELLQEAAGWDTMIAQNLIDPKFPIGLKPTAVRLELTAGGEDETQKAIKPYLGPKTDARYDLMPWSVIEPYATEDAVLTLLLEEWQHEYLNDPCNTWLYHLIRQDFGVTTTLINMEWRGLGWDVSQATKMTKLLNEEKNKVASELPFKPTPQAAKKFFFYDAGRKPYPGKKTPTGGPQLDSEVQERLISEGVEWAKKYHHHEKVKSAISKWYQGWTEKAGIDGRLRCDFDQVGVATGRLGGKHINLVAIPHDNLMPEVPGLVPVRGLIEPRAGHQLWHIDMAQAEVRVGAAIAECVGLLEGFENGIDAHSQMSILIFGDSAPGHRRIAKTLNLAIQYGAGIKKIKAQLEADTGDKWTLDRTREIWKAWHQAAPEMSMAMDLAQNQAETLGYVKLWNDRFRWFEHYRGGPPDFPWTAFNAKCQGGVAEIMKRVMAEWDERQPGTLVNQIHDALLLEVPEEDAEVLVEECAELMVRHFEEAMVKTWPALNQVVTMPFTCDAKQWGE